MMQNVGAQALFLLTLGCAAADDSGEESSYAAAVEVVLAPSLCMLFGSVLVLCVRFSDEFQAAMQNLSAGLLIAAIGNELFPLLREGAPSGESTGSNSTGVSPPTDTEAYVGICSGFALGLLFMFGIEKLVDCIAPGDDDDDDDEADTKAEGQAPLLDSAESAESVEQPMNTSWYKSVGTMGRFTTHTRNMENDLVTLERQVEETAPDIAIIDQFIHRLEYASDKALRDLKPLEKISDHDHQRLRFHTQELRNDHAEMRAVASVDEAKSALGKFSGTLKHIHDKHIEKRKFKRWSVLPPPPAEEVVQLTEIIPWATVFAVTADSAVDGLLIGLAFSASSTAGLSMSIATCIEMGFLGLSFSATIQNATRSVVKHMIIVTIPPLVLVGIGIVGHEVGHALQSNQAVFIGFIAFSIVALLFLVTQELLKEAAEIEGMLISIMFFVGLLLGIIMDKALG